VARTLVDWKERGRLDLTPVLAAVLAEVLRAALSGGPDALSHTGIPVLVVPAPSSRGAVRRRGEDVVRSLALSAVALVRRTGAGNGPALRVAPVLRQRCGVRDQAGLSATERWQNLRSGLRVVTPARRLLPGRAVVLVDDVVTTGATTAAATRTLRTYAANVPAICALAATPGRGALAGPRSLD
jgi:predicted amidophosphoribosyltransferase